MKTNALQNKKVLYLDFDGVLHHAAVMCGKGSPPEPVLDEPGYTLFQYESVLADMLRPTDVLIVLSTSWANQVKHSTAWAKKWLCTELQERVVGRTADVYAGLRAFRQMARGHQVFTHAMQFKPARWIALDDDSNGFDAIPSNFIRTDQRLGLLPVRDRLQEVLDNWKDA